LGPQLGRGANPPLPRLRQAKLFASAVCGTSQYGDQAVSLQWKDVATESRAVQHEALGEVVDGHGTQPIEFGQNRELSGAQSGGSQNLVVELGDVACRLAQGQAITGRNPRRWCISGGGHQFSRLAEAGGRT
jgi:hypothetical protein